MCRITIDLLKGGERISSEISSKKYWYYIAYGLKIVSELHIPEFSVWKGGNYAEAAVRISVGKYQKPDGCLAEKPWFFKVTRTEALLYFSGVAVFTLLAGRKIHIIPVPQADYRLVELYLVGTVFGVLLYQQGLLVYHAGSIAIAGKNKAVVLIGESGAGKSSLAAMLYSRGHEFLSDDVCALDVSDESVSITYAHRYLKIAPELIPILNLDKKNIRPVHEKEKKSFFACREPKARIQYQVQALFILCRGKQISCCPLDEKQSMIEGVRHTIPTRLLHMVGDETHFSQCGRVALKIPTFRLERTDDISSLTRIADCVEQQVVDLI